MKKLLIIIAVLSLAHFNVKAQKVDLKRVEIESKVKSDNYQIVAVGEKGVVVFSESKEKVKIGKVKSQLWSVTLYDIDFKEIWSRDVSIAKGLDLGEYKTDGDNLYLTFDESNAKKSRFQVLRIGLDEGHVNTLSSEGPNAVMSELSINNGNVFYGGGTRPTKGQLMKRIMLNYCGCFIPMMFGYLNIPTSPLLYYCDFSKGNITGIHPKKKEYMSVEAINTLKSGETEVLVQERGEKKRTSKGLKSRIYASDGKFKREYLIKSKAGNILSEGSVSSNKNNKFIIGTYKKYLDKDSKKKFKIIGRGGDNGMYFAKFDTKGKQKMIKFYDFSKFYGFEDFVSDKTLKKVKKKEKKKEVLFGYNLLVHDPVYKGNEMILVSEAYYAEYHTEYYTTTDANGRTVTKSRQVFDGYRTTHGLIASFSLDGELLWSSTFKVNTLSFTLKERIRVLPSSAGTTLAFNYGGTIYSKIIKGDKVLDVSSTAVETSFGTDKVKKNYKSDMDYWYGNYYIAYGYQKIKQEKGAKKTGKKKRTVFYFNKISVN
jgi:hypothetical protein